jgi:hypothetical protein
MHRSRAHFAADVPGILELQYSVEASPDIAVHYRAAASKRSNSDYRSPTNGRTSRWSDGVASHHRGGHRPSGTRART